MYIVTGGAGLIGSAFVWALNQRGIEDIVIVDHLATSEKWKNLRALKYADYVEKDDFIPRLMEGVYTDVEAIIHMGACSATTESDATYLVRNNLEYTQLLAMWAVENEARFIYASSAATYGEGEQGYVDDEDNLDVLRPLNMYGYSKHFFDQWARRQGILDQIVGLKFTNVFGPNEFHKAHMRSVVMRAFEQIQESGVVKLFKSYRDEYADGEQMRDFIYVKDVVAMMMWLLDHPEVNGLYNIGSGKAETWNALVTGVFEALEVPVNIEYIDMPDHLKGKYQYFTKSDMTKLRSKGCDIETRPLAEAVKDYVVNYLAPSRHLGDENL